jgi:heat shock protein HslJ
MKDNPRLENTYWALVELNGDPTSAPSHRHEPHLRLISEEKSLQGFGGCNMMRDSYELEGERLQFSRIATTRMACPGYESGE